MRMNF